MTTVEEYSKSIDLELSQSQDAEILKQRFSQLVKFRDLANGYDDTKYMDTFKLNIYEILLPNIADKGWLKPLQTFIDFRADVKAYKTNQDFQQAYDVYSQSLINLVKKIKSPENLNEATAYERRLLNVNSNSLTEEKYRELLVLQRHATLIREGFEKKEQATVEASRFIETNKNLINILQKQDRLHEELSNIDTKLENVEADTAEAKEKQIQLFAMLKNAGIEHFDEKLQKLLLKSALTQETLEKLLNFWQDAQQEQQEKYALQQKYQGIYASCQFLSAVADRIGSDSLKKFATATSAGVQIYQSFNELRTLSGIALLNPIAAIGMAGLNLLSIFGGGHRNEEMDAIMRQLARISKQVNNLHKDMIEEFKLTNQNIYVLLQLTVFNFENLQYFLKEKLQRQLSDIQGDLDILISITQAGFKELKLATLKEVLHGIIFIQDKETEEQEALLRTEYGDYIKKLHQIVTEECSQALLTGMVYAQNVLKDEDAFFKIFEKALMSDRIIHLFGLLIYYLKEKLKLDSLAKIKAESLMNVEIWSKAMSGYAELVVMRTQLIKPNEFAVSSYDPSVRNIIAFKSDAEKILNVIQILQNDKSLYAAIIGKIVAANLRLAMVGQTIIQEFNQQSKIDLTVSNYDNLIASFEGVAPKQWKMQCINDARIPSFLPVKWQQSLKLSMDRINNKVVDYLNQNPNLILSRVQTQWPIFTKELLMAEYLGILNFSCQCFVYNCVADERAGSAATHAVIDGRLGLEIAVEFNQKRIVLSSPTHHQNVNTNARNPNQPNPLVQIVSRVGFDNTTANPSVMIDKMISATQSAAPNQQLIQEVRDLIIQQLSQNPLKIQLAKKLQDSIKGHADYQFLQREMQLLLVCLQTAGFNANILDKAKNLLEADLPLSNENQVIKPERINELIDLINTTIDHKSSLDFTSPLLEYIQIGIQKLAEMQVIITNKPKSQISTNALGSKGIFNSSLSINNDTQFNQSRMNT